MSQIEKERKKEGRGRCDGTEYVRIIRKDFVCDGVVPDLAVFGVSLVWIVRGWIQEGEMPTLQERHDRQLESRKGERGVSLEGMSGLWVVLAVCWTTAHDGPK